MKVIIISSIICVVILTLGYCLTSWITHLSTVECYYCWKFYSKKRPEVCWSTYRNFLKLFKENEKKIVYDKNDKFCNMSLFGEGIHIHASIYAIGDKQLRFVTPLNFLLAERFVKKYIKRNFSRYKELEYTELPK